MNQVDQVPSDLVAVLASRSVVVEMPNTWEDYYRTLSRKLRNDISHGTNMLNRSGNLKIVRYCKNSTYNFNELNALMNDAVIVSKNSWQHAAPEGWAISDTKSAGFFFEVSEKLAINGMLDLSVLYSDKQPIAFMWGTIRGPHTTIKKMGYDQSFSRFSPGVIHIAKHIEDSIKLGIKTIDFGGEFFNYKRRWGNHYDDLVDIYFYPPGILPFLIRWVRSRKLVASSVNGVFEHKFNKLS
jgi:hypothetical protein